MYDMRTDEQAYAVLMDDGGQYNIAIHLSNVALSSSINIKKKV
jgi:hypothetical protein